MWQIIGLILLPFAWMLLAGMNKAHKEETGVPMPTRSALKAMRRRARKMGVSEQEYYAGWVARKQKKAGISVAENSSASKPAMKAPPPRRHRAPAHEPFTIEHLSMMAKGFGWSLRGQSFGLYYLADRDGVIVVNPYAEPGAISTDSTKQDLEDFLLTC